MIEKVSLSKIKGNPFFSRSKKSEALSEESIGMLAAEIKKLGWFGTALKARKVDGKYEIAFGHRRVEALRELKMDAVDLDIEDLSDQDMKLLMAVENFQRHALAEEDKLKVWEMVKKLSGDNRAEAARILGIGKQTARAFDAALKYVDEKGSPGTLSSRDILAAEDLAGEPGVRIAARKRLKKDALEGISSGISRAATFKSSTGKTEINRKLKERLVERFTRGEISHADDVPKVKRKIAQEEFEERIKSAKKKAPPDLLEVVNQWVEDIPEIVEKLEVIANSKEYADYIVEANPVLARKFKQSLKSLLAVTARLDRMILPRLE